MAGLRSHTECVISKTQQNTDRLTKCHIRLDIFDIFAVIETKFN